MEARKFFQQTGCFLIVLLWAGLVIPEKAYAMHIMEGFLPVRWCAFWTVVIVPFLFLGLRSIQKALMGKPELKMLIGFVGAFAFVVSAFKIPSVTGSSSHMTGVGLGTLLIGPAAMSVLGCIVLIFQALFLGHGGLTTLGANVFSMAVAGPFVIHMIYRIGQKLGAPLWLGVFLAAALGDLFTYLVTSSQLALAFPAENGGVLVSFYKFSGIFAFTQVPLALTEGLLTVLAINFLASHGGQDIPQMMGFGKGDS